jgi:hypothetical protein
MQRLEQGQPLRDAMASAGLSIADLVALTKEADPTGYGVKKSTIGHLISTGSSAREGCEDRAAHLIATSLNKPIGKLFKTNPSP